MTGLLGHLSAQEEGQSNSNHIYSSNLRTVSFHIDGLPLSDPMVNLNSPTQLVLSFDDTDADVKSYVYTIQLCNADWSINTNLTTFEYLKGFDEDDIDDYRFSQKTTTPFTNYQLRIPNNNMSWTKSGNYILKVFEDEDERKLVLSRRFMIAEPIMTIETRMNLPVIISNQKTHQEIDFIVRHKGVVIKSPLTEIKAAVLQNGRWDNAKEGIRPLYIKEEEMSFDYQNKIVFPATKEWRYADLRSFRILMPNVEEIERVDEGYDVYLKLDEKRGLKPYFFIKDLNGRFLIDNIDEALNRNGRLNHIIDTLTQNTDLTNGEDVASAQAAIQRQRNQAIDADNKRLAQIRPVISDYALVYFALEANQEIYNSDVYIFGALTDWQIKDEFKMDYNPQKRAYENDVFLKQGFYNYLYAVVDKDKPKEINLAELEGNWYETENDYLILVYHRPFGQRYDRLVAVKTFTSAL